MVVAAPLAYCFARRQRRAEEESRRRELALERAAVRRLRVIVGVLIVASVIGITLTLAVFRQSQTAKAEANLRATAQANAEAQQAIAVAEAEQRATAQAQTEIERAEAQNVALVAGSQAALANDDTDTALTLAWQAVSLNPDSAVAQAQLSEVAYTPGTIRRFVGQPYVVFDVAFSPDGKRAASSGNGPVAILWDVETGQEIHRLNDYFIDSPYYDYTLLNVEFSPDGKTVLVGYNEGPIILWDVEAGAEIGQLVGHNNGGALGITFSADGQRVASGGADGQMILWDMESGSIIRRFTNNVGGIGQIDFSPDERFILSGAGSGGDGITSLWDVETGEEIRRYGNGGIRMPVFTADGSQALVLFQEGAVEMWRMDTTLEQLLEWTPANRYIPEVTCEQRELYRIEPLCEPEE